MKNDADAFDNLPQQLKLNGAFYTLHKEKTSSAFVLTYEHDPVDDESYLLSVCGETLVDAAMSMNKHLQLESII